MTGVPAGAPIDDGDIGQQRAEAVARRDERGKDAARDAERLDQLVVPGGIEHAQQAGGRGVGLLGTGLAGQPVPDEVGDEQRGVCELEDVAGLGGELVERVERQELQPVALEELGMRHPVVNGPDAEGRAGVAVVERVAEKASAAQQPVVDGPGVDADARDAGFGAERLAKPLHGRAVERQDVPVQAVADLHRVVREACDRCGVERVGPDVPDDHPAAGRAQVDGRDGAGAPAHARTPPALLGAGSAGSGTRRVIGGTRRRRRSRPGCAGRWCGSARGR